MRTQKGSVHMLKPFPPATRFGIVMVLGLICLSGCLRKQPVTYQGMSVQEWSKRLRDRDEQYRVDALKAMRELGKDAQSAEPLVRKEIDDRQHNSWETRVAAYVTWWYVADNQTDVMDDLKSRLLGSDQNDARLAADTVTNLGIQAKPALPALKARFDAIDKANQNTPDGRPKDETTLALRTSLVSAIGVFAKD